MLGWMGRFFDWEDFSSRNDETTQHIKKKSQFSDVIFCRNDSSQIMNN